MKLLTSVPSVERQTHLPVWTNHRASGFPPDSPSPYSIARGKIPTMILVSTNHPFDELKKRGSGLRENTDSLDSQIHVRPDPTWKFAFIRLSTLLNHSDAWCHGCLLRWNDDCRTVWQPWHGSLVRFAVLSPNVIRSKHETSKVEKEVIRRRLARLDSR